MYRHLSYCFARLMMMLCSPQSVSYGSGSFSGTEYTDQVTLGSLVIPSQSIGVASRSSGFSGVDGILGYVASFELYYGS